MTPKLDKSDIGDSSAFDFACINQHPIFHRMWLVATTSNPIHLPRAAPFWISTHQVRTSPSPKSHDVSDGWLIYYRIHFNALTPPRFPEQLGLYEYEARQGPIVTVAVVLIFSRTKGGMGRKFIFIENLNLFISTAIFFQLPPTDNKCHSAKCGSFVDGRYLLLPAHPQSKTKWVPRRVGRIWKVFTLHLSYFQRLAPSKTGTCVYTARLSRGKLFIRFANTRVPLPGKAPVVGNRKTFQN